MFYVIQICFLCFKEAIYVKEVIYKSSFISRRLRCHFFEDKYFDLPVEC